MSKFAGFKNIYISIFKKNSRKIAFVPLTGGGGGGGTQRNVHLRMQFFWRAPLAHHMQKVTPGQIFVGVANILQGLFYRHFYTAPPFL